MTSFLDNFDAVVMTASDPQCATSSSSARSTHAGPNTCHHQVGPMQLSSCGYLGISAGRTAVRAECCRSACLLSRRTSEHTTPLLRELHLRVPEQIQFRLCVLVYHRVHGTAPAYLTESLRLTSEIVARRRLRSVDSPTLLVPLTRRSTLGDRAFPVAAARAWNSLPPQTRAASSIVTFRRETKSHLFRQSFGWQKSGTISCWLIVHCHWDKSRVTFYW